MSQSTPRHIGHVQQTVHAVEIDKRAEVRDIFHGADYTVAEVDVLSVVIELNDFEIVSVPDELLQILWRNDIDLRCRQKCFHADVHHQSAFDHRSHFALDKAVTLKNRDDFVPVLAI